MQHINLLLCNESPICTHIIKREREKEIEANMSNSSEGCLEWLELSNDPEKLYSYLNKHVRVQWRSGTRFSSGWVYTIDPVSMR